MFFIFWKKESPIDPLAVFPWLFEPAHQKLLTLLNTEGGEGRFVGGAIRNSLLKQEVKDFDCATTHPPEKVMEILQKEGLKVVPTGLSHGTVTAVINHRPHEITTLRQDIETDGRRAKVAYTTSWRQDAARRDFTINALSLNAVGQLFDYFGGLADLGQKRVRFIGVPDQRIQEDYLRILRFFRFQAFYGSSPFDPSALEACIFYKSFLSTLAKERVTQEFLKILEAPHPLEIFEIFEKKGFFPLILGQKTDFERIKALQRVEAKHLLQAPPLVRLGALLGRKKEVSGLRLSNDQKKVLASLARDPGPLSAQNLPAFFYRFPEEIVLGWVFLQMAEEGPENGEEISLLQTFESLKKAWQRPLFPLRGEDMLALGLSGKKIGEILEKTETWWIDKNFSPPRKACLAYAKSQSQT